MRGPHPQTFRRTYGFAQRPPDASPPCAAPAGASAAAPSQRKEIQDLIRHPERRTAVGIDVQVTMLERNRPVRGEPLLLEHEEIHLRLRDVALRRLLGAVRARVSRQSLGQIRAQLDERDLRAASHERFACGFQKRPVAIVV